MEFYLKTQGEAGALWSSVKHIGPSRDGPACSYKLCWEAGGLVGNSTGDFILGSGMVGREKQELVPSPDLSAMGCVLGQATSPPFSTLNLLQAAKSAGQGLLLTM